MNVLLKINSPCTLSFKKSSPFQKNVFQSLGHYEMEIFIMEVILLSRELKMRYEKWKRSSSHEIESFSKMSSVIYSGTISVSSRILSSKEKSRKQKYSNGAGRSSPNDWIPMVRIMETGMQWKRCRKSDFRRNLILTVNIIWFI